MPWGIPVGAADRVWICFPGRGREDRCGAPGPASLPLPPLLSHAFPFSSRSCCMHGSHFSPCFLQECSLHTSRPHLFCTPAALQACSLSSPSSASSGWDTVPLQLQFPVPSLPDPLPSSQPGPSLRAAGHRTRLPACWRRVQERAVPDSPCWPEPCLPPQGSHCSSSGDPAEYNLRSRTVLCGTCGQPADKAAASGPGAQVGGSISSGSSASSVTVTRSYRSVGGSGGGGFGDSLVTRSYLLGNSSPRTQVSGPLPPHPGLGRGGPVGGRPSLPQPGGVGASSPARHPRQSAPASCPSCLSPRLEGRGRAGGAGRATGPRCCSHLSLPPLSLRAPRTAASCNPGPGGPAEAGGLPLPPPLTPTPTLHLAGGGLKPKKIPLWFFFFYFFFF